MLKPVPLIAISSIFVFYLLLYALASFQYENKIDFFYKQSEDIFSQLEAKAPRRAAAFIRGRKVGPGLNKPALLQPAGFISILFESENVHGTLLKDLQALLSSFKDQLKGLNLSGLDFSGQAFDLSHANLSEANLQGARLRGIRLSRAKLNNAGLSNVDLRIADLSDADLRGANLFYADLIGANLSRSNLRGLKMSAADFREVDFSQADLSHAILGGARLDDANFSNANLEGADLRYADLSKTIGLKQEQLTDVLVDHNTSLPEGIQVLIPLQ